MPLASRSRPKFWVLLTLIFITAAVYAPVLHYDFVNYDDRTYVTENPNVTSGLTWNGLWWALTTGYEANWHPLTWLSPMLDVQFYGFKPGPPHLSTWLLY